MRAGERFMWQNPDYARRKRAYERLYWAGKSKAGTPSTFDSAQLQAMAEHLATIASGDYTVCMWERRAWLHAHGRDGDVYDGADAVEWKAALANNAASRLPPRRDSQALRGTVARTDGIPVCDLP